MLGIFGDSKDRFFHPEIRFYGISFQGLLPRKLNMAMEKITIFIYDIHLQMVVFPLSC